MVGRAFGVSKITPYPSLDEISGGINNRKPMRIYLKSQKKKGIEVPEGM